MACLRELLELLALRERAEPVAYIIQDSDARDRCLPGFLSYDGSISDEDINEYEISLTPLYTVPPAPVVPEEMPKPDTSKMFVAHAVAAISRADGWNDCRAAMLAAQSPVVPGCECNHVWSALNRADTLECIYCGILKRDFVLAKTPTDPVFHEEITTLERQRDELLAALESLVLFTNPKPSNVVAINNAHRVIARTKGRAMPNQADKAATPKSELAQRASQILADATELANRISDQVGNEYQQFASLDGADKRKTGIKDLVSSEIADFFASDATKFIDGNLSAEMQKEIMRRIATCFYAE